MKIEQLYTGCLAEAAYYIESEGEVAIIDPLRETQPYLEKAEENGASIKYIFETHFHADFVSGHIDLAKKTGATIIFGPRANPNYEVHQAQDGETFQLGKTTIKVLHTPGHTPESSTYLLIDENGNNHAIFTGDTLFIGDVGRPDLAMKGKETKEDLAKLLYHSLRDKIMPLEDTVLVYPAHGAGSACGKNMSSETWSTLGEQKRSNYALRQEMTEAEFVKEVTEGIFPPPQYFPKNALMNKNGYSEIDTVMDRGTQPLTPDAFEAAMENALVIDARPKNIFAKGFIPGSIFIGLDGSFASWVGTLIPNIDQPILLVTEEGKHNEAVMRLARVGYDNAVGYLSGGYAAWVQAGKPKDAIESITPQEFTSKWNPATTHVVDVRKPSEYEAEHVDKAHSYPLDFINNHLHDLPKENTLHVHCKSGYRSLIAVSILKKQGYSNLINMEGGIVALANTRVTLTDYTCPSTLEKT